MELSIVISTNNRAKSLVGALIALNNQDHDPELIEVIVADNGSTDATPSVVEGFRKLFPNFRYIYDPRPGQLVGWHRALPLARADIIGFIDDDVYPKPHWASTVVEIFSDPKIGLATGRIEPIFEKKPPAWHEKFVNAHPHGHWSALWGSLDFGDQFIDIKADYVWGSNFLVRKSAFIEAGGFHPCGMPSELFHFTGDGDVGVGRQIEASGNSVKYHPEAKVEHHLSSFRNTEDEIQRMIFGEGLVISYTHMRKLAKSHPHDSSQDLIGISKHFITNQQINQIGRGYLMAEKRLPDSIKTIFENAGGDGFRFHQGYFKSDPKFREWVLRDNYLNIDACYLHPDLFGRAEKNQATRTEFGADFSWSI